MSDGVIESGELEDSSRSRRSRPSAEEDECEGALRGYRRRMSAFIVANGSSGAGAVAG